MKQIQYATSSLADLEKLKQLAIKSWSKFKDTLTEDNWQILSERLQSDQTYIELLETARCFIAKDAQGQEIIGMAFIVPRGNPTDIYKKEWSYIRFVTVDPEHEGQGIGKKLTAMCIEWAKKNKEHTIALHTSELMHNARHIYESFGFTILNEIPERLGKRYWLYTLAL